MLKVVTISLLSLWVFSTHRLQAQTSPVSLKELLITALENNHQIILSKLDEESVNKKIAETRALSLPKIDGMGNFTNNFERQVLVLPSGVLPGSAPGEGPTKIVAGTTYSTSLGVSATQPLLDMTAFAGLKAAKAAQDYYNLSTRRTKEEVIYAVAEAYYQILALQDELKLQQQTMLILEQLVNTSEGQLRNGLARKIDVDRIRVNLTNAQSKYTQAQQQAIVRENSLKVLLALPVSAPLILDVLDMTFEYTSTLVENTPELSDYQTDILLLESQIRLSTLERKAIQAENYPKLTAFFNYSQNVMSDEFGSSFSGNSPGLSYGLGTWGVRLQVPIFDGLARHSRAAQSQIKMRSLQQQRQAVALQTDANYENARYQMISTRSRIIAQRENVQLSERVYQSTQANYNLGLSPLTDLLNAQTSLLEAQNIYTKSLLDYKLAELAIMRTTGTLQNLVN